MKKVVVELQEHPDYQDAIEYFLEMAENYHGHAKNIAGQTGDHAQSNVGQDPAFTTAYRNMRTLLERFANDTSMQPIFNATDDIYTDVQNDSELKAWFHELDSYIRKVLQEPGYVYEENCDSEARRLKENGKGFFSERYRPHREAWINAVQNWFTAYADDPLNVQLGEDVKRLTKNLVLDSDGKLTYKPHLLNDIRSVILPELLNYIGYVPVPRIEYTDKQFDLVIENLTLEAANLLPNVIEMEARNYFKLSPYGSINNDSRHSFMIDFSQVQASRL